MSFLNKLTNSPLVIRAARFLGLRNTLRKLYYRLARPRNGVLPVKLGTFDCRFHVRTPEQLRILGKAQSGHWRIEVLEFLDRELVPGEVVYDVGSNIGVCTVFSAFKVGSKGQVIAFEPAAQTFQALKDNISLNGLANAHAFQVALGDRQGEAGLYSGEDALFSSLVTGRNGQRIDQSVRVVEGDKFRVQENIAIPGVVMIDVEGFEMGVIQGLKDTLSDSACRAVICEIHPLLLPSGITGETITDTLDLYGYCKIDYLRWAGIPEWYVIARKEGHAGH